MPGPYNTHIIVNVFRSIVQLVAQNPKLLNVPGVFRVSGAKEETQRLLDLLISEQFNVDTLSHYVMKKNEIDSEHLHNILGMIPAMFKDTRILDSEDKLLLTFSKKLKSLMDSQDGKNHVDAAQLFDDFICDLLLSKRVDHQRAGEILDHYCYLMHQVGRFQDINRMTYNNLAIIMAPRLTQDLALFPATDFFGLSGFISQLTPVLEHYITDEKWNYDFKERHADKLEHLAYTRHSILEQLEHMKEASKKAVTVPMKSLMLQAWMLKNQIDIIEKQQQDHSIKRKVRNELSKQLKQLKDELNVLNAKVSELSSQMSMVNQGHRKVQEEINLISLSENRVTSVKNHHGNKSSASNLAQFSIFEPDNNNIAAPTFLLPNPEDKHEIIDYDDLQTPSLDGPK
ncbi:RhoGAP domain-containing protein [Fluoribacter gormanii]|uniref:RhoGAP domain-containing protein n=1 Tax=Fluoribacter gormanii TaxID=464 RepID=UPI001041AFF5|nr:RhoGAP domain-containing protein [Fluoribacter gormanii]